MAANPGAIRIRSNLVLGVVRQPRPADSASERHVPWFEAIGKRARQDPGRPRASRSRRCTLASTADRRHLEHFAGAAVLDFISPPAVAIVMSSREPFTFGIALIPRASAQNWRLIEALLDLTLTSVRAQRDPDFRVVIAGHDRPRITPDDPRVTFLEVDWPAHEPGPHNADSGRKKHAISDFVLQCGGGLLMLLDADDWVDMHLVEAARAMIGEDQIGGLIGRGLITDFRTLRAATLPHPHVFEGEFHRICGSSSIARLRPGEADPLWRDPCTALRSHHEWVEGAQAHGAKLARLPVSGSYLINTSENHSEVHGPYAAWRQSLTGCVNREGHAIDGPAAARFGLSVEQIRTASSRFFERVEA